MLDAAMRRFATHGREGTSIDDIAADSGVRKPTIYELFGSKDDLFRACIEHAVDRLQDRFRVGNAETVDLPRPERIRLRVATMLAYAEQQPEEFQLLARAPYSSPDDDPMVGRRLRSQLIEVLADNYRRESRSAGTPIDDAAEILAHLVFAMVEELILLRFDDPTWDRDSLTDFASSFIPQPPPQHPSRNGSTRCGPHAPCRATRCHAEVRARRRHAKRRRSGIR